MTVLVTGGAGFIGSNFILNWLAQSDETIVNLDLLTYAGNIENLSSVKNDKRHIFIKGDIGNSVLLDEIFKIYKPRVVINFAAESHVDNSISSPENFINTNVVGTFRLLEVSKKYFNHNKLKQQEFRFIHVSTDEVYGTLKENDPAFTEAHPYKPNSPYSASKAASDHLARSYYKTYNLPVIITNCSNNYGPRQFPEKLIPLAIKNALSDKQIPIYGDGKQVRDWLYVEDHCNALLSIIAKGKIGETYNIGGLCEMTNINLIKIICEILDNKLPKATSYLEQIVFVKDRPGHDRRYGINPEKLQQQLKWEPKVSFKEGIEKTICWYLKRFKNVEA